MNKHQTRNTILLWAGPLLFIAVLFYLPLLKITALGLSGNWIEVYFEPATVKAIWFTIWQAAASTGIAFLFGIPGAYLLYRKRFYGQRFIRALITVPLVLPTIVVAIIFSSFNQANPIGLIIVAHVFVNYSLIVRTVG